MSDFPAGDYDRWKTTEPDYSHRDDDTTCPHGEDRPDDCEVCNFDPVDAEGPNGCTCGFNGDCNCPFVETP